MPASQVCPGLVKSVSTYKRINQSIVSTLFKDREQILLVIGDLVSNLCVKQGSDLNFLLKQIYCFLIFHFACQILDLLCTRS